MAFRRNSTTTKTGSQFRAMSVRKSPSTKKRKPAGRVFGTSSQFRGVGVGRPGDPRR